MSLTCVYVTSHALGTETEQMLLPLQEACRGP